MPITLQIAINENKSVHELQNVVALKNLLIRKPRNLLKTYIVKYSILMKKMYINNVKINKFLDSINKGNEENIVTHPYIMQAVVG